MYMGLFMKGDIMNKVNRLIRQAKQIRIDVDGIKIVDGEISEEQFNQYKDRYAVLIIDDV